MLKVKDVYEKFLKEVTCNLRKVLNESVKSIKKVLRVLESARKSPPIENPHHAETNHPTLNANKLTRRDLRTDQSTINTCNFIVQIE